MDQLFQLQRQIQDLKQEINTITQVANQLRQAEANNAMQLQQLHQHEVNATQQLQTIQQVCNRINQDVNMLSNAAQQVSTQMATRPITTGQFGTSIGNQFRTGQFGNIGSMASAGLYNPNQISSYGSQITPSNLGSLANYWGQGLSPQDMQISSQYLSNKQQFIPQSYGSTTYGTGISQSIPYQYGTSSTASSQYIPSYSTSLSTPNSSQFGVSLSTPNQFGTGMFGSQSTNMLGTQYMGSSF